MTDCVDIGRGGQVVLSGVGLELSIPWLFGANRILLPVHSVAVCDPRNITDDTPGDIERTQPTPEIAFLLPRARLTRRTRQGNLMLVFAEPVAVPPVRLLARLTALGMIYASARRRSPVDGFLFGAPDPERAIAAIKSHGVEITTGPRTWISTHRRQSDRRSSSGVQPGS